MRLPATAYDLVPLLNIIEVKEVASDVNTHYVNATSKQIRPHPFNKFIGFAKVEISQVTGFNCGAVKPPPLSVATAAAKTCLARA